MIIINRLSLLAAFSLLFSTAAWAANCDGAGNCYVRAGATGTHDGSSWVNAYTGFGTTAGKANPASLTRGVTYWIAAGSYGTVIFGTANSGSTVITLEAATTSSHGPAVDWNGSYAGVASFVAATFGSDYWTVDGQTRGTNWQSGYNFKFQSAGDNSQCINVNLTSNVTLRYIECQGFSPVAPNVDDAGIYGSANNFYIGYSYVHDVGDTNFQQNSANTSGMIYEYNWVSNDGMCGDCNHFEAYSLIGTNVQIRYNVFENIVSTGIITDASGGGATVGNWEIYGNIFFWEPGLSTKAGWPQTVDLDDGVVVLLGNNYTGHFYFYNNTIEGISPNVPQNRNCALDPISTPGAGYNWSGVTIMIQNNLWVNNGADVFGGCQWLDQLNNGRVNPTVVKGYNTYAGGSNGAVNTDSGDISHVQTSSGTVLVSGSPLNLADFSLKAHTTAGVTLASPYNLDGFNQVSRGADGTWDRGAMQFGTTSTTAPPTNPSVSAH